MGRSLKFINLYFKKGCPGWVHDVRVLRLGGDPAVEVRVAADVGGSVQAALRGGPHQGQEQGAEKRQRRQIHYHHLLDCRLINVIVCEADLYILMLSVSQSVGLPCLIKHYIKR